MAYIYKRKNNWYIIKKEKGCIIYSKSTGESSERAAALKLEEFIRNEKELLVKTRNILCSLFAKEYLELKAPPTFSEKTYGTVKASFNEFIRVAGDKNLKDYTIKDIDKFLQYKIAKGMEQTAARIKRTISPAFNLAIKWGYLKKNVLKDSMKIKTREPEITYLEKPEYFKLIEYIKCDVLRDIVIWASHSGMRQMEIVNLKPSAINVKKRIITVFSTNTARTKSGKTRYVEMNSQLIPIYNKYKKQEYLFINPETNKKYVPKTLSENFKNTIRALNLNDSISFHSLRSTYGMWMLAAGANLKFISQQLGHSSVSVTEKYYAKYLPQRYTGEVDKINF